MKKVILIIMSLLLSEATFAYDIAVENDDGVTIYYNYSDDGKELVVTNSGDIYNQYYNNIVIPEKVTYMNKTRKVTSIGEYAFSWCNGLTSVTIPNSVTSIGSSAFSGCFGLTSVTIPNSVTSIGDGAFSSCTGLTSVTLNSNAIVSNDYDYTYTSLSSIFGTQVKEYIIGKEVTSIGNYAFSWCTALISVTIPNSVTSIGNYAFSLCNGLTSITIPNSVTSIGESAFRDCTGLTSINIDVNNSKYDSRENCNAIIETVTNTLLTACINTIIPNSVTSIGDGAFSSCNGLTSITIPNSVTSIGESAFRDCTGLTSITIPNSVTSIGSSAFRGVDVLSVISMIENPFIIYGKSSSISRRTFSQNTFYNATLYVPKGTIEKYKATEGWKDFVFIEEITQELEDAITEVKAIPILIQAEGNIISVQGAAEGTEISAYNANGIKLSSTIANKGITTLNTQLPSGSTAIVKIGEKAVKVLMK